MSEENLLVIILKAISDLEYRELLFNDPDKALEGFELDEEESECFRNMERQKFDKAFGELEQRVSRAGLSFSPSQFQAPMVSAGGGISDDLITLDGIPQDLLTEIKPLITFGR